MKNFYITQVKTKDGLYGTCFGSIPSLRDKCYINFNLNEENYFIDFCEVIEILKITGTAN